MTRNLLTYLFFQCLAFCGAAQQRAEALHPRRYFDDAFHLIRQHYYRRDSVNFPQLRTEAGEMMRDAKTPADTYPAIRHVIQGLQDKHCHFLPPSPVKQTTGDTANSHATPQMPFAIALRKEGTAVLSLYSWSSSSLQHQREVADSLYSFLISLREKNIRQLVIDLRKIEGGANAPFLCGLGGLVGHELLFTYVDSRNGKTAWHFRNGSLWRVLKKAQFRELSVSAFHKNGIPPLRIAVITGPYTASAGEIIGIMLKGLPGCRSFGTATYGLPTGVAVYPLADGARIALAGSVPQDRQGRRYTGPVMPEVLIPAGASEEELFSRIAEYFKN